MKNHSSLTRMNVTISTVPYEITVSDSNKFYTVFNVTNRSVSSLVNTGCFINNYNGNPDYSSGSMNSTYQVFVFFSFFAMGKYNDI